MPSSTRPGVPRLSSNYIKNLPVDNQVHSLNESIIPPCGVEIIPRSKSIRNSQTCSDSDEPTTKVYLMKSHMTAKTDNDDDSTESPTSVAHKNLLDERTEKVKTDRLTAGREYAKKQRKLFRLEAIKAKEDAEREKILKIQRLADLKKKARQFAGEPLPEYPRQQLAKSRFEVKVKNEVYIPPPETDENEMDVSTYALQWALGEDSIVLEGQQDEGNSLDNVPNFDDYHRNEKTEIADSTRNKGEHNYDSITNPPSNRNTDHNSSRPPIPLRSKTNGNSIFNQGIVNNMGRITVQKSAQKSTSIKPPLILKNNLKMFSPSYRQEIDIPPKKDNKISSALSSKRMSPSRQGSDNSNLVIINVRDTKGNIVRQVMKQNQPTLSINEKITSKNITPSLPLSTKSNKKTKNSQKLDSNTLETTFNPNKSSYPNENLKKITNKIPRNGKSGAKKKPSTMIYLRSKSPISRDPLAGSKGLKEVGPRKPVGKGYMTPTVLDLMEGGNNDSILTTGSHRYADNDGDNDDYNEDQRFKNKGYPPSRSILEADSIEGGLEVGAERGIAGRSVRSSGQSEGRNEQNDWLEVGEEKEANDRLENEYKHLFAVNLHLHL
jgi:hypothetical protein